MKNKKKKNLNLVEVVLENLRRDFEALSSSSINWPTGLSLNVVVGFGSVRKGIIGESEAESFFLTAQKSLTFLWPKILSLNSRNTQIPISYR